MKLIEGMKLIKELQAKADDLRKKVAQHCAHLSIETPVYPDQTKQVREWLQAHEDISRKIAELMVRVSKTNLATEVTITVADKPLTKTITEWIARRRLTAKMDELAWIGVGDKNLKEGAINSTQGSEPQMVKIVRCYDPKERDAKVSTFRWEPGEIDRQLEIVNATTDLLE